MSGFLRDKTIGTTRLLWRWRQAVEVERECGAPALAFVGRTFGELPVTLFNLTDDDYTSNGVAVPTPGAVPKAWPCIASCTAQHQPLCP